MDRDKTHFDSALDVVNELQKPADLTKTLQNVRDLYQVAHLGYHALLIDGIGFADLPIAGTCDPAWVAHYVAREFVWIDPVAKASRQSNLPIDWATVDHSSMDARQYFRELSRFEIGRQGIGMPIHGADGSVAVFTFTSQIDDDETWWAFRRRNKPELAYLGQVLHQRILAITGGYDGGIHLPRQTRICLQFFAEGASPAVIARKVGLSVHTVRRYLDGGQQRLGCRSKAEVVAKAVRLGLIRKR